MGWRDTIGVKLQLQFVSKPSDDHAQSNVTCCSSSRTGLVDETQRVRVCVLRGGIQRALQLVSLRVPVVGALRSKLDISRDHIIREVWEGEPESDRDPLPANGHGSRLSEEEYRARAEDLA